MNLTCPLIFDASRLTPCCMVQSVWGFMNQIQRSMTVKQTTQQKRKISTFSLLHQVSNCGPLGSQLDCIKLYHRVSLHFIKYVSRTIQNIANPHLVYFSISNIFYCFLENNIILPQYLICMSCIVGTYSRVLFFLVSAMKAAI